MACKIIYGRNPDGSINESIIQEVKAPNQKRSFLFDDLKKLVNDDIEAVNIYYTTFTGDFKELLNPRTKYDSNNEVTIDQFVTYYNLLFDMYNDEIANGFRRKDDTNRKQIIDQNEAIKLARNYNTKNPQSKYVAKSFKRTGEKGDTRVYHSVKLFPRGIYNETLKRGNPDPNIESKYFSEDNTTDSVTILSKIANSSHPLNKVAENLIKYAQSNNVNIKLVDSIDDGKSAGAYYSTSNRIEINKNSNFRGLGSEPTIIHEILHSLSFDILQSDYKVKQDLEKLYEYAIPFLEKDESYKDKYGITSLDEFMVGLFSDADLIRALEKIPPYNKVKGYNNLFQELYDYILNLFGFKKNPTLYTQAFSVATNVLETSKEYFDSFSYYENQNLPEPIEYALYDEQAVNYELKAIKTISNNIDKIKQWESNKSIDQDTLYKKIQELGIPKDQVNLLKESQGNTIEQKLTSFISDYSYTVKINIGTGGLRSGSEDVDPFTGEPLTTIVDKNIPSNFYSNLTVPGGTNYTENEIATPAIIPSIKGHAQFATDKGIGWFRSDEKIYLKKEETKELPDFDFIETFNTSKGIVSKEWGTWYLGNSPITNQEAFELYKEVNPTTTIVDNTQSKTRRILELQSDLFQKGRNRKVLSKKLEIKKVGNTFVSNGEKFTVTNIDTDSELYELITIRDSQGREATMRRTQLEKRFDERGDNSSDNQFLQLLNKDNNWVTFFTKSIIQDSAKKGYKKVLFPRLDTIIQVESSGKWKTYEEAEKAMKDDIWQERDQEYRQVLKEQQEEYSKNPTEKLKQLIIKTKERIASNQPSLLNTAKFYETDVTNILKKQGYNPTVITDEYGNTWNEIVIDRSRDLKNIQFKKVTEFNNKSNPQLKSYKKVLDSLSNRFGIKYTIVNNPNANWAGRYLPDGTIQINEAFIEQYPDAPFHEFFHPFLDAIAKDNKALFDNLKQEINSLLQSKDPADAELKSLLQRVLNDRDYVNADGTLNELGYKEAITELVGAHALKAHNDAWVKEMKAINPKWNPEPGESATGPGMSEARQKRLEPLFTRLFNYIKNLISKLRPSSNVPTIPSQLNPNMTLSDLGYLMGVDTKPVRLNLSASQDMPIQYKKFDDNNWINPNTYNNSNYSEQQKKFVTKYNEVNKNILDEKITVDVAKLSNKKIADLLSKKTDTLELYKKRKDAKGREYVENRVTMKQDLKFLQRTQKTKEEFLAEENAPASVLAREMGTKLHAVNESILKRLLELDLKINTSINKEDWAEITFNELMVNDPFYKQYIDQIRKGDTPFVYEETSKGESYPIIDENGEYLGEEVVTSINKDSTRSFDEMFKSMLRIYHEVYNIQNSIDPTKKPLILMELPLYDEKADEVGSTDFMAIFSDNTSVIYDHKFINFKYNKVTFEDYKKRPENKGKSDEVLLDEIYAIRQRQGFGEARYKPNKNRAGNEYFFEIDDTNIDGLYRWKQDSYDLQLSRYADMMLNVYGIKKVRQVRVVPNAVSYTSIYDAKEKKMKIDPEKSKLQFLMTGAGEHSLLKQIPSTAELTNDVSVNQFIKELETEKLKLRNQLSKKGWDNNPILVERFNEISDAIISLKVDNGLMKVADIVKNLITDINYRLDKGIKLEKDDEGNDVEVKEPGYLELSDINDYMKQLEMYSNFVKYTKSHIDKLKIENEVEFNKFTQTLETISAGMILTKGDLVQQSLNRLSDINKKYDFMSKQRFESYAQQADINGFENLFTHLSNVRHPLVNMFKQMLDRVTYNRFEAEKDILAKIKKNNDELITWAKGRGISIYKAYEMLLNKDKNLIGKWSKEFYNDVTDHKEINDKNRDWFKKNMKRSSQQEKSFKAYKDKVETSFKNKYGDNYKDEFNKWLNKNDITYNNGNNDAWFYVNPAQSFEPIDAEKYYDERYKTILKNKPLKQFYDFYREMNVELANMVDFKITANFVPEIHKDMIDSLFQNGLSVTKIGIDTYRSIMNNFTIQENRDLINIAEEDKSVPVMFTDKIATEEKSIDLAKSMMLFASYVHQYKGLKELESAALALRQLIADTAMVKVDKKTGQKQRIQGSRAFETVQKDNKKILELMDTMVSHYVYGERLSTKLEGSGISPRIAKTINKVLDLNSKKNISFNFLSAAAGHLGSMAQINKIAKQGKYFTAKQLRDARASVSRFSKEAYFANEYFRISQEDITGEIANQINANALRNKYTKGGAYLLQRRSEDVLDHTILLAMMDNYSIDPITNKAERIDFLKDKYKDDPQYGDKFEWPTIKKMVEFKDNIGKMINPFTGKEFGEKEYISFRRKVQEIGKKTRGNMSEEDIASYKTTLAGQILMQFKGWIPAMLRERVKKQQYDVSTEEFEVGSWIALFHMVKAGKARAAGELMANMIPFLGTKFGFSKDNPVFDKLYNQWKDQNPEDFAEMMNKYGLDPESEDDVLKGDEMVKKQFINEYVGKVKGTAKELQMYLLFMLIMLSIMWAAGDDEDETNPFIKGAISLLERSMLEVGFFLPGFDFMSTQAVMGKGEFEMGKMLAKGPIPSLGLITDTLKGAVNTLSETLDITTGISPFEDKYFDLLNIGKEPFENPFNPKIKRDSAPMFKYTSQYIPGVKGISDLVGIFNTTEKEDTIWDWISGPEGVAGTGKRG